MTTVGDIVGWMDAWYPPGQADSWDRVGLILGSRTAPVKRVLLAVDPVQAVADQAVALGADLVITHHPLYLRGASFISEDDPKGRLVTQLIRANIALFNAHTNADVAHPGVAQALADLIGLQDAVPMKPRPSADVTGPVLGHGRIGTLPKPLSLEQFARHVAGVLPAGPNGLLVGGHLQRQISRVAVSGGSGDSFLDLATDLGADAFLTADLRHHPASEHLENPDAPALLSGSHWATEWPWLPVLADQIRAQAQMRGVSLEVFVSRQVTEPWAQHLPTEGSTE